MALSYLNKRRYVRINITLKRIRLAILAVEKHITYSECLHAALDFQQADHIRRMAICGLPRSTVFFHIIS